MNQEMTERIAETKELVTAAEWREKILACQESGKPVTAWCEENGISPSTYYRKLRMMREDILSGEQQIVPIKPRVPHGIRITAGEISTLVHPAEGYMTSINEEQPIVGITYILKSFQEHQNTLFGSDALIYKIGDGILDLSRRYPLTNHEGLLLLPSSIPPNEIKEVKGKIPQLSVFETSVRAYYGAQPIRMTSAIYVNINAANLAGAYAFLSELTSEENRYSANLFGSPLFPGLDRYYRDNDVPGAPGKKNRASVLYDFSEEFLTVLDPIMNDYYEASTINLFVVTDRAKEAIADFVKGTMSVENTAEILYQELVYTLKG